MPHQIYALTDEFDRRGFCCGKEWLDNYLRRLAIPNQKMGYGRSYVAVRTDGSLKVDGFFTIAMGSVQFENLPDSLKTGRYPVPRYPMPTAHLGALAVDRPLQGNGLGKLLLMDAIHRMVQASEVLAARAIEVKADTNVIEWYGKFGFMPFTDKPFHLFLPMETARQLVSEPIGANK